MKILSREAMKSLRGGRKQMTCSCTVAPGSTVKTMETTTCSYTPGPEVTQCANQALKWCQDMGYGGTICDTGGGTA